MSSPILVSRFGLAAVVLGFDRQDLITLFTNDAHLELLGADNARD